MKEKNTLDHAAGFSKRLVRSAVIELHHSVHYYVFKGIVHPKMEIQLLTTHPHADGRSGEVF